MIINDELVKEMLANGLPEKLVQVITDYRGSSDDLIEAIGMVVVGRLYGWKVMRLVSSKRRWQVATRLFGDPKLWMEPEGDLAYRATGYQLVKEIGGYWDFISGKASRDDVPLKQRKMLN